MLPYCPGNLNIFLYDTPRLVVQNEQKLLSIIAHGFLTRLKSTFIQPVIELTRF